MAESRKLNDEAMLEWCLDYEKTEGSTIYSSVHEARKEIIEQVRKEISELKTPLDEIRFIVTLGKIQRHAMAKKFLHLAAFISGLRTYCISELKQTELYQTYLEYTKDIYNKKYWKAQEEVEELQLSDTNNLSPDELQQAINERDELILVLADLGCEQFIVRAYNQGLLSAWDCSAGNYIPLAYSPTYHEHVHQTFIANTKLSKAIDEKTFAQFLANCTSPTGGRSVRTRGRASIGKPEPQHQSLVKEKKAQSPKQQVITPAGDVKALPLDEIKRPRVTHHGINRAVLQEWLHCYRDTCQEISIEEERIIIELQRQIAQLKTPEEQIDLVVTLGKKQRALQNTQREKTKSDSQLALFLSAMRVYCINELMVNKPLRGKNDSKEEHPFTLTLYSKETDFHEAYLVAQNNVETMQLSGKANQHEIEQAAHERDELVLALADLGHYRFIVRAHNQGLLKNWPHPTMAEAKAAPHQYNVHIPYAYSPTFDHDMYMKMVLPGKTSQELEEHEFKSDTRNIKADELNVLLNVIADSLLKQKKTLVRGIDHFELLEQALGIEYQGPLSAYDLFIQNCARGTRAKTRQNLLEAKNPEPVASPNAPGLPTKARWGFFTRGNSKAAIQPVTLPAPAQPSFGQYRLLGTPATFDQRGTESTMVKQAEHQATPV